MKELEILEKMAAQLETSEEKSALEWVAARLKKLATFEELDKDCNGCPVKHLCGYPEDKAPCLCEDSRLGKVSAERFMQLAKESGAGDKLSTCEAVVARLYAAGELGGSDF